MHNEENNSMFSSQYNQEHRNTVEPNETILQIHHASNEVPLEEGEDSAGPDSSTIDTFLLSALDDSVHRLFVLKLEKEFLRFAMEPMMRMLEFPGMAPFPRLVIHRVAGYFRLARSVRGTSGNWRRPIVVFKNSRELYVRRFLLTFLLAKCSSFIQTCVEIVRSVGKGGGTSATDEDLDSCFLSQWKQQ